MKPIKMFGLAALAALTAMAFVGASSAMAESTALCTEDSSECTALKHVHETTLSGAKAKLLSALTVECDVLFLGDTVAASGNPLEIKGNFTYTNCGGCTVKELTGESSTIKVLKEGHETAKVTGEGKVFVDCGGEALECEYDGEGLSGTAKGPLLSTETNGEVSLTNQVTHKAPGSGGQFCPKEAKLDIKTTPLMKTYIVPGSSVKHWCRDSKTNAGNYKDELCLEEGVPGKELYLLESV